MANEYVTLLGADDVRQAGGSISRAASEMRSASQDFEFALQRHQQFMDDWLTRFESTLQSIGEVATANGGRIGATDERKRILKIIEDTAAESDEEACMLNGISEQINQPTEG